MAVFFPPAGTQTPDALRNQGIIDLVKGFTDIVEKRQTQRSEFEELLFTKRSGGGGGGASSGSDRTGREVPH